MSDNLRPLVSVVTPVHNGGRFLAQCIESVLSQTYDNFEYIVVDNGSTDESLKIARSYAGKDPRIAVYNTDHLLKATSNFNYSLTKISSQSKYCKIVHADDWIFPECLAQMVQLAEANPSVVLVSSYRLIGKQVGNDCLPYPSLVIPGPSAARSFLLGEYNVFGNPSATMLRCDSIRRRATLYEESGDVRQAIDCQVCLDLLRDGDLGFVHQVLTFSRVHSDSLSSKIGSFAAFFPERLHLIRQFGPKYLTPEEHHACWNDAVASYARVLALNLFLFKGREFWRFHRAQLRKLGLHIGPLRLFLEAVRELGKTVLHPVRRLFYWRSSSSALSESKSPANLL